MMLVRTSYTAWNRHEDDHGVRQQSLAVLRHITRQARQAKAVMGISTALDASGTLSLLTTDGRVLVWDHDDATNEVLFGENAATELLATDIEELTFVGIKANGADQTTDLGLIHSVDCTTKITLTRPSSTSEEIASCRAWLRAW